MQTCICRLEFGLRRFLYGTLMALAAVAAATTIAQDQPPQDAAAAPPQEISVLVQDATGAPVAGADVDFIVSYRRVADGLTDAAGRWRGSVPADAKDWAICARKSGVGFDYATAERSRGSAEPPQPLPGTLMLTLDGARTLKVRAVDRDNRPVAGVKVGLWMVHKPDREAEINMSGLSDRWAATGEDGTVVLDWLPLRVKQSWPVMYRAENHFALDHAFFIPADKPVEELTINLLPLEELSGRVTHADGSPAENILVMVQGQGAGMNRFNRGAQTDADGRYKLRVFSECAYVVAVSGKEWAAPYQADVVVRAGQPVANVDFVLQPATRIHGRVTIGTDERPAPNTRLNAVIDKGQIPEELRRKDDRIYHPVSLYFQATTDADGRYEFHLGPGEYWLQGPPRTERVKVIIPPAGAPAGIVQDFRMPRPETGPLTIRVVDQAGQPVAGAVVSGQYASSQARRFFNEAKTDGQGILKAERSLDPLVLHARSADGQFAGVTRSEAEADTADVAIGPVATASGRLLDKAGLPVANRELRYGILIYQGEPFRSPFTSSFGGRISTDGGGRFTLGGLVVGQTYDLDLPMDDHRSRTVKEVKPLAPGPFDLGDLTADTEPYKPYVPPTPAERAAAAFDETNKPAAPQRLAKVLAEAQREYTRPLIVLGEAKDPACVELFRLFYEGDKSGTAPKPVKDALPTPQEMRWEFELLALDREQPANRKLLEEIGVAKAAEGPPRLAVLSSEGALTAIYPLVLEGQKLSSRPLAEFLFQHKLPTRDASQMLAAGLKQAQAEDNRVFFIFSASWCAPCRLLAAFLAEHKAELERHFVFVKLDVSRDERAEELREQYKESKSGGVPWYTILDAQGRMLVTSNAPGQERFGGNNNIGFPGEPAGIEHFVGMLRQTAPRLSAEKLDEIRTALLKPKP